jgi:hypothetical protein
MQFDGLLNVVFGSKGIAIGGEGDPDEVAVLAYNIPCREEDVIMEDTGASA